MKKGIIALLVMCFSFLAWAGIKESLLAQEFEKRGLTRFTKFEKLVIKKLGKKGNGMANILQLKVDEEKQTFTYVTLRNELCSGSIETGDAVFTCKSLYSEKSQEMLTAIYLTVAPEKILNIELFDDTEKFVFEKTNKEICQGDYIFGKAQYFCYSTEGILSGFAGGDSD